MITYQEFEQAQEKGLVAEFIENAIRKHQQSDEYRMAADAENYMRKRNTTICQFQRLIYDVAGRSQIDPVGANFKCASGFFKQTVTQLCQYLLANGVTFKDESTKQKLGGDDFDRQVARATRNALAHGMAFGFYDYDQVRVWSILQFVPFWDEYDGTVKAGVYFWQIDRTKPLCADLYTIQGKQSFIRDVGKQMQVKEGFENPQPYRRITATVPFNGEIVADVGQNYPTLPIVPIYGNEEHQSELVGLKENIDAYDLTKCGLINDISDMPLVYWVLENAGGMDEQDLAYWRNAIQRNKVAKTDDEVKVTANSIGVPYQAQETILTRLEKDIYNDSMALNTRELANGNVTATAIDAASEPLNNRADELEYCVNDFVSGLLALIGIQDTPHYVRSRITNQLEEVQKVMMCADVLDEQTLLEKLPFLTPEEVQIVLDRKAAEAMDRLNETEEESETEEQGATIRGFATEAE